MEIVPSSTVNAPPKELDTCNHSKCLFKKQKNKVTYTENREKRKGRKELQ